MRKLTTNAVAMLLALVGCMGCGNRSASSVDNLIRVDVMADYPEKELILQDLMDVEYIALETTERCRESDRKGYHAGDESGQ